METLALEGLALEGLADVPDEELEGLANMTDEAFDEALLNISGGVSPDGSASAVVAPVSGNKGATSTAILDTSNVHPPSSSQLSLAERKNKSPVTYTLSSDGEEVVEKNLGLSGIQCLPLYPTLLSFFFFALRFAFLYDINILAYLR